MEPVLATFIIFGTVALVFWKYNESKTRIKLTMLEKGMNPEEYAKLKINPISFKFNINPLRNLQVALLSIFIGLGIFIAIVLRSWYQLEEGIIPAIILIFGGIGILIFYFIASKKIKIS